MQKKKRREYTFDFSAKAVGEELRKARHGAGYYSAKDFCKAVAEETRYPLTESLLYKFEQGRQEMKITQLFAVSCAISGGKWEETALEIMRAGFKPKHTTAEFWSMFEGVDPEALRRIADSLEEGAQDFAAQKDFGQAYSLQRQSGEFRAASLGKAELLSYEEEVARREGGEQ